MTITEGVTMDYKASTRGESRSPVCVVGIGASAGGLEALQQFLTFLPGNTNMAFVIIQHLAPDHKSMLAEILAKYTVMPVTQARDGMRVERNHIYMIPPKYNLEIVSEILRLRAYDHAKINHPVDIFFRSLASAYENRAVAVILSGTGSDGTNGIRSIKEQNGLIIVQTPETAKFDGMPRNAISTGFVDLVQNPDSIAREMAHIAASMVNASSRLQLTDEDMMAQVFNILKNVTNINYTFYKQTTILRRIERRLVITHNRNLREYVNYLSNNPEEAKLLAKEVLIGVTSFFRDADYFDTLKEKVIKPLVKDTARSNQIRVWVAGCSTGEEAYSIAILFKEAMDEMEINRDVKIFATDLDAGSIGIAARAVYGDNIIEDVSVTRLSRYFTRKGNKYVIRHDIRKMIIFAQHNVFQDPPFGKLDLISCRNLLIYFQTVLQRNLFAIFHMALKDKGILFLGRSESVIDYDDVFRVMCANEKIFIHNAAGKAPAHDRVNYMMQNVENNLEPIPYTTSLDSSDVQYKTSELQTNVLEALMPATVLVNEKNELWRSYGDCDRFLSIPPGAATLDIFSLIRNDLKIAVSTILRESRQTHEKVVYDNIPVQLEEEPEYITIVAQPIYDKHDSMTDFTAIAFLRGKRPVLEDMKNYRIDTAASQRISNLEKELKISQDNLSHTVTELESVNAELQAANEELLTANEELQSSNEELQSVNEELYTVNSEYQSKVNELAGLNDDMANFLSITLVGVLMVDRDLNIRKFTEYIATEFNVAEQDVGRSLRYISFNFGTIDLMALCREVLRTMTASEHHCASVSGRTYLIRIAPYQIHGSQRNTSAQDEERGKEHNRVKGLVLTFVDTTRQVNDQAQIEEMAKALKVAVRSSQEKETFLSHMSHDMRTPMAAILGLTELSLEEKNVPETVRDNLQKIQTSSGYMMNLIEEILETSRINAGKIVSVCSAVRENALLEDIETIISEQCREASQKFECVIHDCQRRYVMMDTEHVERILMNLLGNAVKYTPEGGHIQLDIFVRYLNDEEVEHTYIVKDSGRGISEEFLSRMFLPFEQESEETEREGTGLGLYISKNLVDLLGGTINCRSEQGKGTTFTVVLTYKIATAEQIRLQKNRMVTFEDHILHGKNVLVAEDSQINAEVIIKLLAKRDIHAELARDGQEAVEFFLSKGPYHYQAILMDVRMPVLSGVEAAKMIRGLQTPDARTISIIGLTADMQEATEEQCLSSGMNDFLPKPVDTNRLFMTLASEFERQEQNTLDQSAETEKDDGSGPEKQEEQG